jgi:thymidylate kinase
MKTHTDKGQLLVFEGPNRTGKTTLSRAVAARLREAGVAVEAQSFPGRDPGSLGALIYALHRGPAEFGVAAITPAALQALHVAAHLDAIERVLVPRLAAGAHVVLDRFWWSTLAYGRSGGAAEEVLDGLVAAERRMWGSWIPALVVVLEREGAGAGKEHERLRAEYRALAEMAGMQTTTIQNNGTIEQAVQAVGAALDRVGSRVGPLLAG